MTRDDIIRTAKEAGWQRVGRNSETGPEFPVLIGRLERFAALVAAHEREQCKEWIATWVEDWCEGLSAKKIAHGIRGDGNDATKPNKYVTRCGDPSEG
jgi:hypothetical protein